MRLRDPIHFSGVSYKPVNKRKTIRLEKLIDFSKLMTFNSMFHLNNRIFAVILSIIALRFSFQLFGFLDNPLSQLSYAIIYPIFHHLGTLPFYGRCHVEKEALIGIAFYALLSSLASGVIKFLKDFEQFRHEIRRRESLRRCNIL